MLEGAPTVLDMFLNLASMTQQFIPRAVWLDDPVEGAQQFMDRGLNVARLPIGAQKGIATQVICAGAWAASGYPTLEITHRLAATLMATRTDRTIEANIVAPFVGVTVRLPDNLLFLEDDRGELSSCTVLSFASYDYNGVPSFSYTMMAQKTTQVFGTNMPHVGFVSDEHFDLKQGEVEAEEVDERSSEMARKLIVGLCLYLSDPSKLGEPKTGKKKKGSERQRTPGQLPQVSTYVIGKEIKLDSQVIIGVREYVKHGHKAPSVQYIVRGHWKMQPYGPGRSERKLVQIMPYWRGPVDAPILMHGGDASQIPAWIKKPEK